MYRRRNGDSCTFTSTEFIFHKNHISVDRAQYMKNCLFWYIFVIEKQVLTPVIFLFSETIYKTVQSLQGRLMIPFERSFSLQYSMPTLSWLEAAYQFSIQSAEERPKSLVKDVFKARKNSTKTPSGFKNIQTYWLPKESSLSLDRTYFLGQWPAPHFGGAEKLQQRKSYESVLLIKWADFCVT